MVIIDYKDCHNIVVEFEDGYRIDTNYDVFTKGQLQSVYERRLCHVGFKGKGDYKFYAEGVVTPQYNRWRDMINRGYNNKLKQNHPTYQDCSVCEEWYNFQNFAKWYDENFYQIENEKMCLDKDILVKGNKIYSPETCCFVPHRINCLFSKRDNARGSYPLGVMYDSKKYFSQCHDDNDKCVSLGKFNTVDEAFKAYKTFKESVIKIVAFKYKDKIPNNLYNALCNYEVTLEY
jgi:hypothetical protein